MNGYIKRVLILKSICDERGIKCLVKLESLGGKVAVNVSALTDFSRLGLAVGFDSGIEKIALKNKESLYTFYGKSIENGVSLLVFSEDFLPLAYGEHGTATYSELDLLSFVKSSNTSSDYNDETIATENYYKEYSYEPKRLYNENSNASSKTETIATEKETATEPLLYENDNGKQTFYDGKRKEIESLISSHPANSELTNLIPHSNFVDICYDKDRKYSFGTVIENGTIKYLCYAVKGSYYNKPIDLTPYCRFIPLSRFFSLDSGYFVIFQSAETGNVVTFD